MNSRIVIAVSGKYSQKIILIQNRRLIQQSFSLISVEIEFRGRYGKNVNNEMHGIMIVVQIISMMTRRFVDYLSLDDYWKLETSSICTEIACHISVLDVKIADACINMCLMLTFCTTFIEFKRVNRLQIINTRSMNNEYY